jgi:hypothetical protein
VVTMVCAIVMQMPQTRSRQKERKERTNVHAPWRYAVEGCEIYTKYAHYPACKENDVDSACM